MLRLINGPDFIGHRYIHIHGDEIVFAFFLNKIETFILYQIGLLSRALPENVKLLSFEPRPWYKEDYILRLEHIYDFDEHPVLSSPALVSLKVICLYSNIYTAKPTTHKRINGSNVFCFLCK